jgi:hypothetical protein
MTLLENVNIRILGKSIRSNQWKGACVVRNRRVIGNIRKLNKRGAAETIDLIVDN